MLFKMIDAIFRLFGYVPAREKNSLQLRATALEKETELLKEELAALADENASVWDMVEELQSSTKFSKENTTELLEQIKDALTDEMLKDFKAVGEA